MKANHKGRRKASATDWVAVPGSFECPIESYHTETGRLTTVKILADYRINPKVERMMIDHRFVEQVNNAVVVALEDAARRAEKKFAKGGAK